MERWAAANPEKIKRIQRKHRLTREARKRSAFVEAVDPQRVFARSEGICGICYEPVDHAEGWHVDHIIPLSKGGAHSYANTQLAHAVCNVKKADNLPAHGRGGRIGSSAEFLGKRVNREIGRAHV